MPDESSQESTPESAVVGPAEIDYTTAQQARFYANHAATQVTLFDIRLILSSVHIQQGKVVAEEALSVILSPELAFMIQGTLAEALQKYTDVYGALRIPKQKQRSQGQAEADETQAEPK